MCVRAVWTVVQRVDDDPGVLLAAAEGTVVAIVHAVVCRIASASVRCYLYVEPVMRQPESLVLTVCDSL